MADSTFNTLTLTTGLLTPASGYEIKYEHSIKGSNFTLIEACIQKTSGKIPVDTWTTVATINGYSGTTTCLCPCCALGSNIYSRCDIQTNGEVRIMAGDNVTNGAAFIFIY